MPDGGGGPRLRRDMYGNIFFGSDDDDPMARMMMMQRPDMPRPVLVADVMQVPCNLKWT